MKKLIQIFLITIAVLLMVTAVNASATFDVSSSSPDPKTCATITGIYVMSVKNTGDATDSYTITLSGEASNWAVSAPSGFQLLPGSSKQVYIYITPSLNALVGDYSINAHVVGQAGGEKVINIPLKITSCHDATITAEEDSKEICSCTMAKYTLSLANTGKYKENFELTLSGSASKWASLSEESLSIDSGKSREIFVYATPDCDQTGQFDLTVTAKSTSSNVIASKNLSVISQGCYDTEVTPETDYVSFCEHEAETIPITISNEGTTANTYTVSVVGPAWAKLENDKIDLAGKKSANINLILNPDYGVSGDFDLIVKVVSKVGDISIEKKLTANVETCHSTDLKISTVEDVLCPYVNKTYTATIVNSGKYDEAYSLTTVGANWAELNNNFIELGPGESREIELVARPDTISGNFVIKVMAESQYECKTSASDVIKINVPQMDSCFGVKVTPAITHVDVAYGEAAVVPIIIDNKGTEESNFTLDIAGTGANYVQLNPAAVTIPGQSSETVYMYVSVPEETPRAKYPVTISARTVDGIVSSSADIEVQVVEAGEKDENALTGVATGVTSGTEQVGNSFSNMRDTLYLKYLSFRDWMWTGLTGIGASGPSITSFLVASPFLVANWIWLIIVICALLVVIAAWKYIPDSDELERQLEQIEAAHENENADKQEKKAEEPKQEPEQKDADKKGIWSRFKDFLDEDEEIEPKSEGAAERKPQGQEDKQKKSPEKKKKKSK